MTTAPTPQQPAAAGRSGGAMVVLLTLAAGQFLMTLDSSVMNVSIATVAKDVGTTVTGIQGAITAYTLVMAALMITGAKIGGIIGRKRAFGIGCVIYGVRLVHDSDRAEPAGAALRLVVPRGRGCRADPARHRRSRGRQLHDRAPPCRVRHGRGRRRDRGRDRAADRRHRDHLLLVAVGFRGRGRARPRHPRRRPPDRRRAAGNTSAPGRGGIGALGARTGVAGLRRPALGRVGMDPAEGGRALVGGPVADDLARDRAVLSCSGCSSGGRRDASRETRSR